MTQIKKVAVIGAGTMGGGIAAHCINAGLQVVLLDAVPPGLTPDEEKRGLTLESKEVRNRFVKAGLERIKNARPAALFDPQSITKDRHRQCRGRSWTDCGRRLDRGGDHRTTRTQARPHGEDRTGAQAGQHRVIEHLRHSDCRHRCRALRGVPPPFPGNALLQSATLSLPARSHSNP